MMRIFTFLMANISLGRTAIVNNYFYCFNSSGDLVALIVSGNLQSYDWIHLIIKHWVFPIYMIMKCKSSLNKLRRCYAKQKEFNTFTQCLTKQEKPL